MTGFFIEEEYLCLMPHGVIPFGQKDDAVRVKAVGFEGIYRVDDFLGLHIHDRYRSIVHAWEVDE